MCGYFLQVHVIEILKLYESTMKYISLLTTRSLCQGCYELILQFYNVYKIFCFRRLKFKNNKIRNKILAAIMFCTLCRRLCTGLLFYGLEFGKILFTLLLIRQFLLFCLIKTHLEKKKFQAWLRVCLKLTFTESSNLILQKT